MELETFTVFFRHSSSRIIWSKIFFWFIFFLIIKLFWILKILIYFFEFIWCFILWKYFFNVHYIYILIIHYLNYNNRMDFYFRFFSLSLRCFYLCSFTYILKCINLFIQSTSFIFHDWTCNHISLYMLIKYIYIYLI